MTVNEDYTHGLRRSEKYAGMLSLCPQTPVFLACMIRDRTLIRLRCQSLAVKVWRSTMVVPV